MIALLQVVSHAEVVVDGTTIGAINKGLLVFLGVQRNDSRKQADRLVERVLGYRIFQDSQARLNLNVKQVAGELLIVPQFTLAADTQKGMRPSFTPAAQPELGKELYLYFVSQLQAQDLKVETGEFGAYMQVSLCNEGPLTFWLDSRSN